MRVGSTDRPVMIAFPGKAVERRGASMSDRECQALLLDWMMLLAIGKREASGAFGRILNAPSPCEYHRTNTEDREIMEGVLDYMATRDDLSVGRACASLLSSGTPCVFCPMALLRPGGRPPRFACRA